MKITLIIFTFFFFQMCILAQSPIKTHNDPENSEQTNSFLSSGTLNKKGEITGKVNSSFRNLKLKSMDGRTIALSSLKGKYIYLNFWGEWCPGCREEMSSIVDAFNKYKDKAEFIGLLKPHDLIKAKKFIHDEKMEFTQVILLKEIKNKFRFDGFPLSIMIYPDGKTYLRVDEVNKDFFNSNIK